MANKVKKPVPKSQREISTSLQNPSIESQGNPNSGVLPLPSVQTVNSTAQSTAYRGEQISVKGDVNKGLTVSLQDTDEAILYYFENVIKPTVYQNNTLVNIPVIYGNPERWKAVQKDGYYRDKNAKLMAPLIMYRRASMERNYSLGNKLDANNPTNYAYYREGFNKSSVYSSFDVLNNRKPVEALKAVVIPDYVTITYECVIWTYYIEQMNKIVESVNYAANAYWGDPARFKFHARIDTFTNNETLSQGEERLIKTEFSIKLHGYIVPNNPNNQVPPTKKIYTKGKLTFTEEVITNLGDL